MKLTKTKLKEMIKEEIMLLEQKNYTISGSYVFMKKTALPLLNKLGVTEKKVREFRKATMEISFNADPKTFKKVDAALKQLDKSQKNYQGTIYQ